MKVFKSMTALILALVMAAMLAVSAYAATVVVKYKVYVYTSQLTFKQYDYSSSTTPSTRNLTILADSSLGSGSALYHVKYVNGALAYCIQPGVRSDDSSNYVQGSSGCWYNLPTAVQSGIALALACGYPSAEYGTAYGDSNSSDIIGAEKWAATQAVIWDLICEYRSPYDYRSWGSSPFYNCVDTSRYPTFALWYSEIVDAMQSATDIPSFAATSSRWCDTIELTKDSSGNYSASVTDSNGVLGDFNFSSNSGNGITFSQKGNTLTITATPEAAKNLNTEKTYSATGSAYGIDPDEAVLCWYDSTGKYQSLASYTGTGLDPVRAYIKIKATVTEDKGSLTINKTDADTGKALAGVTYRLYDANGNKVADVTTGTDGTAVFSDLPLGSYSYQEISAPEGYVVDSTKYPITITASALNITATRTNALGKASVEISKVDTDSKSPLQNAGFRLYDASGSQVAEGYTDANGKLMFANLKLGSYTCKEFQAPTGYELDETAFPATLNQNEQVLKVTRENKLITGSIEILKVDADTKKPLAGVVYRLFDADGNKIADGTTDANGKVTFDNLKPGSYSYQEISTVDGYQLDETKYDFSLTSENLNVKVTRENKPIRGCLTVHKVDVTGSPLAGAELLLETSTDGQTWTAVSKITTDKTGIAQWTDLKIGAQYRVTEVKAPAGYDDTANTMTIRMTDTGLSEINEAATVYTDSVKRGYSDCAMRITYAATLTADAKMGDTDNPNEVVLTWKRTNTTYYDTLEDCCHVYTYGVDVLKQFSDGKGNIQNVKFNLHNDTDDVYVVAEQKDGVYYAKGITTKKSDATTFIPNSSGHIIVKGLENDSYSLTETATDKGYVLLKEAVKIVITTKENGACEQCGVKLLTASATVNGKDVTMTDGNAIVPLTVVNNPGFDLPKTGGRGVWMYTVGGVLLLCTAAFIVIRSRKQHKSEQ